MGFKIVGAGGAFRIALSLVIVGSATTALGQLSIRSMPPQFIQVSVEHEPSPKVSVVPVGQIDTNSFFPQIDNSISQRGFRPKPGEKMGGVPFGPPNGLKGGGIGGNSKGVPTTLFPGIGFTGWVPPDCSSAVGTAHVVQTVNSSIGIFDKATGNQTFGQTSTQFFAGTGGVNFQFDPRVIYDQYNDRFIILFLGLDEGNSVSQFLLAVSDDGNPNGVWNRFLVDSSSDDGITDSWFDYPGVGHTADSIVISGNMFAFGGGFTAIGSFVIPTAPMYNNTGATATPFISVGLGFNIRPGVTYTPGATTVYGISLATLSSVRLWAFTGLDTATPALTSTTVAVQGYQQSGNVAPSGGSGGMDTITGRTMDACSRGTAFFGAHTVATPGGTGSSVRWYEFDMGSWPAAGVPSLVQQGNISLNPGEWAFMPALSTNQFGDVSVIYTRSSTSIFSDLVISTRVLTDPAGTMSPPTLLRSGLAAASPSMGFRWGDYFTVTVDPTDDATFWGHGEVVRGDGRWATEITSWTVTTGGGGGGGGTNYPPTSVSTVTGTYGAGALSDVLTSDNLFYDVNSAHFPGLGHFAAVQADFLIVEAAGSVTELTVTVEENVDPGVSATGMVFLWNWNTGAYEYGKAFGVEKLGNDLQGVKIKDNPGRFVSNTGQVRALIRAHDAYRRRGIPPSPFRMRTDFASLNIKS